LNFIILILKHIKMDWYMKVTDKIINDDIYAVSFDGTIYVFKNEDDIGFTKVTVKLLENITFDKFDNAATCSS